MLQLPLYNPSLPCAAPVQRSSYFRKGVWNLFLLLFIGAFLCFSGTPTVLAASKQATAPHASVPPPCTGCLGYNGGPVMHDPKVYLVFWGPGWAVGVVPTLQDLFMELAGGMYNNILTQYYDANGHVHNDVTLAGTIMDSSVPPASLSMDRIGQEASSALSNNSKTNDSNTLVLVFPQNGSTYDNSSIPANYCGKHGYAPTGNPTLIYGFVRYGGCGSYGDPLIDMQAVASHEYAEAVTDPQLFKGWVANDGNNDEVADLCQGRQAVIYSPVDESYVQPSSPTQIWVAYLWDNSTKQCQVALGREFVSPDRTPPFQGKHTVSEPILTHYLSLASTLGEPTSEMIPVTDLDGNSGQVSYFANGCGAGSAIYWSSDTGVYEVQGCIMAHYKGMGEAHSALGFPVTDEIDAPGGGRVNYFAGTYAGSHCTTYGIPAPYINSYAAIYWNGSAANAVKGCIYNYYQHVAGGPAGSLGLPTSEETPWYGGVIEYFAGSGCGSSTGSAIYDKDGTGIHAMKGCLYYYYNHSYSGTAGLGFPTSDELSMGGGHGQHFESGTGLYDGPGTGIHLVIGAIYQKYLSMGEANSFLGFPSSEETGIGSGRVSYFGGTSWGSNCGSAGPSNSHAAIYWTSSTGAHEVHGCIYNIYVNSYAGPNSFLGFPTGDQVDLSGGGHTQDFQNGYITYDASGNVTVRAYCPQFC